MTGGNRMRAYYGRPRYWGGGPGRATTKRWSKKRWLKLRAQVDAKYDKLEAELKKKHEDELERRRAKLRDLEEKLTPEGYARYVNKYQNPREVTRAHEQALWRLDWSRRGAQDRAYMEAGEIFV